jgi:hypothetical protein
VAGDRDAMAPGEFAALLRELADDAPHWNAVDILGRHRALIAACGP